MNRERKTTEFRLEKAVPNLQLILIRNQNSYECFTKASEGAINGQMKAFFILKAKQRKRFVTDLNGELSKWGETSSVPKSGLWRLRIIWMEILMVFTKRNDKTLLEECIRADKSCVIVYKKVLIKSFFLPEMNFKLEKQLKIIQSNVNRMEKMFTF